ncbi:sugar phosphate isomerase/epimerase [Danxiaibacter flavus]|uniref:Sugar phosphate isomerase/epimerase n=1 Tax=Danxiaibacter flavus TaxID=3049108 RepID=A0ABV3ZIU6_9BACT|nr:sugar phosphate isomerase/epimerase [Chitinophagaceae bacterium DXS]
MANRRDVLKTFGLSAGFALLGKPAFSQPVKRMPSGNFRFCLNTSTINGQKRPLKELVDIAARAGYDGVELWIEDVKEYRKNNSLSTMKKLLSDSKLQVEDAIGFAPWMNEDETKRKAGFAQMKEEMQMMAELGCKRIAAPSAGVSADQPLNLFHVGQWYKELIDLGRQTGVMPQLEFWGSSPVFYTLGQAMMAATAANDKDARVLPDVYHLFRGGSGFNSIGMLSGQAFDVIHMNDYPGNIPREQQHDSDRVYPGDGVAPLHQLLTDLAKMNSTKVLSLELFNQKYWKQDPLTVAKTGLEKMQKLVAAVNA